MFQGPQTLLKVVAQLSKLPGIGEKTAQRLAFFLVHAESDYVKTLASVLTDLKTNLRLCSNCCGLTDEDPCPICKDPKRQVDLICVVEYPSDLFAIERSGQFRGTYHVLHGTLSPLDGVGPDRLKVSELLRRIEASPPREVLLATNPDVEGEATALYLARQLGEKGIATSRIAMGLPMGGHLEFADQGTLARAILERRQFTVGS